jgi:hypothetical protein
MNYRASYDRLLEQLMHDLSEVETDESARDFSARAVQRLKAEVATTKEFYVGEFLNMLKDALTRQVEAEAAASQQVISDVKLEASLAKVELEARLSTARAANDREAEHVVWREREERQAAGQSKIDAASRRLDVPLIRLKACSSLFAAFGFGGS